VIGGIMEHIEEAGIHSGDSACVLPPHSVKPHVIDEIIRATKAMAAELKVVGLMNVQYAVKGDTLYVIEVNPRASRTVPFVSKATGVPLARIAAQVAAGETLESLGLTEEQPPRGYNVKAPVFPFARFPGDDTLLGPEMRSTGEVMGIGDSFGEAFAKAMESAGQRLPVEGAVFLSVTDSDKENLAPIARDLKAQGFQLLASGGTAAYLTEHDVPAEAVFKVNEGEPNVVQRIQQGDVKLIINTPLGRASRFDERAIRRAAIRHRVPCVTTMSGARAAVDGIAARQAGRLSARALQENE